MNWKTRLIEGLCEGIGKGKKKTKKKLREIIEEKISSLFNLNPRKKKKKLTEERK